MIAVKCLEKKRDKFGAISSYRLVDQQGQEKVLTSKELKSAIASNQIQVINLKLTKDNRLVDQESKVSSTNNEYSLFTRDMVDQINSNKTLRFKSNRNFEWLAQSVNAQGCLVKQLGKDIVSIETESTILVASNKKIRLTDTTRDGKGLFRRTGFSIIDLRDTDSSKVKYMNYMFYNCYAKELNLSELDTSNAIDMSCMFGYCAIRELDLRSFDTSKVNTMQSMFNHCATTMLDLRSFDTSKVEDMRYMFDGCEAQVKTNDTKIKGQLVMRSL